MELKLLVFCALGALCAVAKPTLIVATMDEPALPLLGCLAAWALLTVFILACILILEWIFFS